MDKAQLKLYGSVHTVSAEFIGAHPEYRQAEFRCPVCFERVRWIVREITSGQSVYFAHGRQQEDLPSLDICELRTKSIPGLSNYIRARLPLYLTRSLGRFSLNVGLPGLDNRVLELSKSLNLGVEIKAANQLPLELKRAFGDASLQPSVKQVIEAEHIQVANLASEIFRPLQRTLIPLEFIPRFENDSNEQQQLTDIHLRLVCFHPQLPEILGNAESASFVNNLADIIHNEWAFLVDGFGPKGAFFHYDSQLGRQVKRGSILVPGVKYYLLTPEDYQLPDFLRVIDTQDPHSFQNEQNKLRLQVVSAKPGLNPSSQASQSLGKRDRRGKSENAGKSGNTGKPLSAAQAAWLAATSQLSPADDNDDLARSESLELQDRIELDELKGPDEQFKNASGLDSQELVGEQALSESAGKGAVKVYAEGKQKVFSAQFQYRASGAHAQDQIVSLVVRVVYISTQDYKLHGADIERRLNQDFCLYVDTPAMLKPLWPPVINQDVIIPVKTSDNVFCSVKGISFKPEVYREISSKQSEALCLDPVKCNPQVGPVATSRQLCSKGATLNFTLRVPLGYDLKQQQDLQKQYAKLDRLGFMGRNAFLNPAMTSNMAVADSEGAVLSDVGRLEVSAGARNDASLDFLAYPTAISWGNGESLTFQNAKVKHRPPKYELSFENVLQQRMALPWRSLSTALQASQESAAKLTLEPSKIHATSKDVSASAPTPGAVLALEPGSAPVLARESSSVSSSVPATIPATTTETVATSSAAAIGAKPAMPQYLTSFMASLSATTANANANPTVNEPAAPQSALPTALAFSQSSAQTCAQPSALASAQTTVQAFTPSAQASNPSSTQLSLEHQQLAQPIPVAVSETILETVSAPAPLPGSETNALVKLVPDLASMRTVLQTKPELWCLEPDGRNLGSMRASTSLHMVTLDQHSTVLDARKLMPNFTYGVVRDISLLPQLSSVWVIAYASHYRNAASVLFAAATSPQAVPAFDWTGLAATTTIVPATTTTTTATNTNSERAGDNSHGTVGANNPAYAVENTAGQPGESGALAGRMLEGLMGPLQCDEFGLTNDIVQRPNGVNPSGAHPGNGLLGSVSGAYTFDLDTLLQLWGAGANATVGVLDNGSQEPLSGAESQLKLSAKELKLENWWCSQLWNLPQISARLVMVPVWGREVIVRCRDRHWALLARQVEHQVASGKVTVGCLNTLWNLKQFITYPQNCKQELGIVDLEQSLGDEGEDDLIDET